MTIAAQRLERIIGTGGLDSRTVARILERSPRTVSRWLRHGVSPRKESQQRLGELDAVIERLRLSVDPGAASAWMFTPVPMLDGRRPADLVRDGEYRRVIAAIDAIGEGAFV